MKNVTHPLSVGTVVIYDGSVCGCNERPLTGTITKVEVICSVIVYEINNAKQIPARRIMKIVQ